MIDTILLIDDDATTNHVNKRLLLRSGKVKNVDVAESGSDALSYLSDFSSESGATCPDIILLDLKMDGMTGFDFLDRYAALPESKKAGIMVALTSSASFYDLDRLKNYPDVADHLYKPLTDEHLANLIDRLQKASSSTVSR